MTGRGGKQDIISGNAWILAAANDGQQEAQTLFNTTKKSLSPSNLAKVKKLAKKL